MEERYELPLRLPSAFSGMIDPRALRTFLAVCRAGSISAAARQLNISQPSVSVAVAQLERSLRATLFERGRSGISLSSEGEALKRYAEAMDHLLRDAEEEVALTKEGVQGPLRVGGTPGALASLVPEAVQRLEQQGIRFALHVIERPDRELTELLRTGEIEIAFVTTGVEIPPSDLAERTVASDPFALLVGRENDHLPDVLPLRETAELRWVLPAAAGGFRRQIEALFLEAGTPLPSNVIKCDSLLTTKAIVRTSGHVTILPTRVAAAELSAGVLRAIDLPDARITRNVGVRTFVPRSLSRLAQQFIAAAEGEHSIG